MSQKDKKKEAPAEKNFSEKRRKFIKKALIVSGSLPVVLAGSGTPQFRKKYELKDIGFNIHKKIAGDRYFVSKMINDPEAAFEECDICAAPKLMAVIKKTAEDIASRARQSLTKVLPRERNNLLEGDKKFVSQIIYNPVLAARSYNINIESQALLDIKKVSEQVINRAQVLFSEVIRNDIAANNGACNACNGGCG